MALQRIKDVDNFKRDPVTGAILATSADSLRAYRKRRRQRNEIKMVQRDINNLKKDMAEIKEMMATLLTKGE